MKGTSCNSHADTTQAYIAISLDSTGALRFLAFWVAKKGGSSGWKLHFYLFAFFLVLGGIVGNVSCARNCDGWAGLVSAGRYERLLTRGWCFCTGPSHLVRNGLSGILHTSMRDQAADGMDILTVYCCESEYVASTSCIPHFLPTTYSPTLQHQWSSSPPTQPT